MLGPRLLHFSNKFKALKHSHIECTFNAQTLKLGYKSKCQPQSQTATTNITQAY